MKWFVQTEAMEDNWPDENGYITTLDKESGEFITLKLLNYPHKGFHPHGIGTSPDSSRLFVNNHGRHGSTTAVFDMDLRAHTLTWKLDVFHPKTHFANGVVAWSSHEFYVSVGIRHSLVNMIRFRLGIPTGSFQRCTLSQDLTSYSCNEVAWGVGSGNGVSKYDNQVIVVGYTSRKVFFCNRNPLDGSLTLNKTIDSHGWYPDNVKVDPSNGDVYFAAHGSAIRKMFTQHNTSHVDIPWNIQRVAFGATESEVIIQGRGNEGGVTGATGVAYRDGHIYVGQLFEEGILDCQL